MDNASTRFMNRAIRPLEILRTVSSEIEEYCKSSRFLTCTCHMQVYIIYLLDWIYITIRYKYCIILYKKIITCKRS